MTLNLASIIRDKDAAKRMSDTVNLHLVAASDILDVVGKWVAFKLEDGTTDGSLYDRKDDAVSHQSIPKRCCYLKITPDGITEKDAGTFLKVNRHPYIDTTAPEHVINPSLYPRYSNLSAQQKAALNRQLRRGAKRGG